MSRLIRVMVGATVVGAFASMSSPAYLNCLRSIAPGCKVDIKKSHYTRGIVTQKHPSRRAKARQQSRNSIGRERNHVRIILLKPGEFTL